MAVTHIEIQAKNGPFFLVSDIDAERVAKYQWSAYPSGKTYAVRRHEYIEGKRCLIYLHRFIMGVNGPLVDHIDGNGLNCTRENLRHATHQQNIQNASLYVSSTCGYKGVTKRRDRNDMWRARIGYCNRKIHLGYASTARDAALLYDGAARYLFGDFARLNNP